MSQPSRLDSLLSQWQKLRAAGQDVTPEALCADCPELLGEVRPLVEALRRVHWVGTPSEYPWPPGGANSPGSVFARAS